MEEQLEQSKRRLHFCMALIGGWFGAYAILRFHHFASAVTVNFIEVFTSAVQENWIKALLRLGIVILYVLRFFSVEALPMCGCGPFCNAGDVCGVFWAIICIFAMGFQWVFAGKYGFPVPPSFLPTTSASLDAFQAHLFRDSDHIPRMNLYGGTLLAFHAGVIAECVLWAMGWGSCTILPVLLPAVLALAWQRRDFRMRERIEEAFEPHHTA